MSLKKLFHDKNTVACQNTERLPESTVNFSYVSDIGVEKKDLQFTWLVF